MHSGLSIYLLFIIYLYIYSYLRYFSLNTHTVFTSVPGTASDPAAVQLLRRRLTGAAQPATHPSAGPAKVTVDHLLGVRVDERPLVHPLTQLVGQLETLGTAGEYSRLLQTDRAAVT